MVTVEYVAAAGLGMLLFAVVANLLVWQFQRGVAQLAADQGARAASVRGGTVNDCRRAMQHVLRSWPQSAPTPQPSCRLRGRTIEATVRIRLSGWLPLVADHQVSVTSVAAQEPP